jgi:periplasmic protein TonB
MRDRVADVLAQRATLDRNPAIGVAISVILHAALAAGMIYAATHAEAPVAANVVSIQFAQMPAMEQTARPVARPAAPPKIEEPKPVLEEPKPVVEQKPPEAKPPEKNTVPMSPFGQSTKKGSETLAPPAPSSQQPATATAGPPVAVGASGVTGLEGGDFPYALYIQGMHRKIGSNWFRPQVSAGATVIVYFRILRDGTITDAKVHTASGNGTFDRAALSAVRSASPLNPLPFAYSGTYLGVHLTFR